MQTRLFRTESFRLSAIYASLFVGSMLALMALVYLIVDAAFRAQVLDVVDRDLAAIERGYTAEGINEAREIIGQRLVAPGASDLFVLQDRQGHKLAGNLPAMAPATGTLSLPRVSAAEPGDDDDDAILGKGMVLADGTYVFAGRDLHFAHVAERRILEAFAWVLAIVLVIGATGGVVLSRAFLARMDAITDTCRAIMAGDLTDRIATRGTRNELDRLGNAINAMLDRIAALMDSLRQVTSDVAHDMRTPLTHLRNRLEAARDTAGAERTGALDGAIADTDAILSMFAALLRIAQIEAGTRRAGFATVELGALLAELAALYAPDAEDSDHSLTLLAAPEISVRGDRQLLLQLFANIVANALTHTPVHTAVTLSLKRTPAGPQVVIADNGPGVPEKELAKIFRRFYRLERSRSSHGAGLGLSLATAIAELHGATLVAKDNHPGLRMEITFSQPSE